MAIGTQFSSLVIDLRAELRRPSDVSVGVDDADSLKRVINSVYTTLLTDYDWPHLNLKFDKIPIVAGQRLYDFPTGFDPDAVQEAVIWYGGTCTPIRKGIGLGDYTALDPDDDQRSDPVLAWDTVFDFSAAETQIEVWPIPATSSAYDLQFKGAYAPPKLVDDDDRCFLDDELIIGFSAARLLEAQGSKDAKLRLSQVENYLHKKKVKPKLNSAPAQMGLGRSAPRESLEHPQITISPSGS